MILELTFALLSATAVSPPALHATQADDPAIKVWLNSDNFTRGDRAQVRIRAAQDGYVVVLRADADGHVRVLFPLDPGDDEFIRGDKEAEIRGRGDRDAFSVDEQEGQGLVFAAWSPRAFRFDGFVRGDHWDYGILDTHQSGSDAEAAVVDLVQQMAGGDHFDYDVATYTIQSQTAYDHDSGPNYGPYFGSAGFVGYGRSYGWGIGFQSDYWGGCGSWFYGPYSCGPVWSPVVYFGYNPFYYGHAYYGHAYYGRGYYGGGYSGYGRGSYGHGYYGQPGYGTGGQPRVRFPEGSLMAGGTGGGRRSYGSSYTATRVRSDAFATHRAVGNRVTSSPRVDRGSRRADWGSSRTFSGSSRRASGSGGSSWGGSRSFSGSSRRASGSGGSSWGGSRGASGSSRGASRSSGGGGGGGGGRRGGGGGGGGGEGGGRRR